MRVLHTSDWHLGRSFHGFDILDHQRAFVEWLVDLVAAESIDLVVIAGDVYDRAVPPLTAVALWEEAVIGLTGTCQVLVTSGNHDSPTRLGFAGALLADSGLHLRTGLASIDSPLLVPDADGPTLAVYGLPYLEPDLHRADLGAERSHAAVLDAAMDRVRADAASRGDVRTLVVAHAFITGGGGEVAEAVVSDSERDLRVGGVGDAPAHVFRGVDAVALGHLHGAQQVRASDDLPLVHYSGSPLAFSFSEERHEKSVTVIDFPPSGRPTVERIAAPVPRPLVTLTGTLDEILARPSTPEFADHWVRVHLADARRPDHAMDRLRAVLPFAVELTFERGDPDVVRVADIAAADPVTVAEAFVEHVTSTPADDDERDLLRHAVEHVRISEVPA